MLDGLMGGVPEQETVAEKRSARVPRPGRDDEPTKVEPVATGTSIGSPIEALERGETRARVVRAARGVNEP